MRIIPLKELDEKDKEGNVTGKVIYRTTIENILNGPVDPRQGLQTSDIRKSLRILDALDDCVGDELLLEDADYSYLKQRVESFKGWLLVSHNVLEFEDDIKHAKAVKKEEKKDKEPEKANKEDKSVGRDPAK